MANPDAAFGFRPIGPNGGAYTGQVMRCFVPSIASEGPLFVGDVVTQVGLGTTDGYPHVKEAAATEAAYGVITSFDANPDNTTLVHRAALTPRYCQVVLAENNFFEVQFDGLSELADVGLNTIFVVGAGSTATGYSTTEISATDVGTSIADEVKIIAFVNRADNDPTLTNANVIIKFNEPGTGHGTVGV